MASEIRKKCTAHGLKMTGQRKVILQILSESPDHPDVAMLHKRVHERDPKISMATVYRTVRLLEETGIINKLDFSDGRARYEAASNQHHDHLIDLKSGKIIEFTNEEIEQLQKMVAKKLGYTLVGHRLELYGTRLKKKRKK